MTTVAPYHTTAMEYPPQHRNVYHNHDDCKRGKQIDVRHRISGTGNKPRCEECTELCPLPKAITQAERSAS